MLRIKRDSAEARADRDATRPASTVTRGRFAALVLVVLVALAGCSSLGGVPGTDTETGPGLVTEGETLTLDPAASQAVEGRTDLAAGAEIAIRLQANGGQPFLKSESTTVESDGTFAATFNMSGVEPGTAFEVTVSHNGTAVIEADGRVAA
mgnify:CR=1 FL=1